VAVCYGHNLFCKPETLANLSHAYYGAPGLLACLLAPPVVAGVLYSTHPPTHPRTHQGIYHSENALECFGMV